VDADLRPEGKQGAIVRSLDSYRSYYERWAETWEFQALTRARPIAGDEALGEAFVELIDPYRYPATFTPEQVQQIRRMKARVENERMPHGADRTRQLKLGRGGLSDVEWLVQLVQLRPAHAAPPLRPPPTLPWALAATPAPARVPASTFKVLTLFALNRYANLQARLRTRVTRDAAGLYLMAGGDTLLGAGASDPKQIVGRAGLGTLAELTVKALLQGEKPTAALPVYLDGTFFTGPSVNPGWDDADVASGQITPIHPIALESHTVPGESTASNPVRPDDAAVAAQQAFVNALNTVGKESGMSFTLAERRTAPAEAVEIAAVESATLLEQAQHMMLESDNALAEVLGRCAAIAAGKEGSGEAAQQTVHQALVDAGVNIENLVQADVCGMSLTDRVTAQTLVQVVALLNADEHAEQLMSTFPVAGVSGTLSGRFGAANAVHARTFVQAKTGTLYTVSSLCGVATRPDGTRLIFAIILNDLGGADALPAAKERVDAAAAAIANRLTAPSASAAPSA